MTRRASLLLPFLALSFVLGRSTGSVIYDFVFILLALITLFSLLTALQLLFSGRVRVSLSERRVKRGDSVNIVVTVRQWALFPAGTCRVRFLCGDVAEEASMRLHPFQEDRIAITVCAAHVGTWRYTAKEAVAEDLFGLFRVRLKVKEHPELMVLPKPFDVEKPEFIFSDEGQTALPRGQEDLTSPEAVRLFREGDPMKRVHWKISARKREMYVRTYETPAPPDTLILLDTASPDAEGLNNDDTLVLRDVLCETCDAVANMQLKDASPVRIPFYGGNAGTFRADLPDQALVLEEMLARQMFTGQEKFELALSMELNHLATTGAVIVISTRLTPEIVDAVNSIRKMGPSVRYYFVSFKPDEGKLRPLVSGLQRHLVEVCYVTPA